MTPDPALPPLEEKQRQFNAAMARYEALARYRVLGKAVSVANVALQAGLLALAWRTPVPVPLHPAAFVGAYLAADFVNGLVHLYMDGNDDYTSAVGPLVAAFHLHHQTPRYRRANLLAVYFNESGAKLWLVGWLLLSIAAVGTGRVPPVVAWGLAWFGILSSVAEVSHYCCHVLDSRWVRVLRGAGLLLSKRHHGPHHRFDNVNYAFLNGATDPLLNAIARRWGRGYRNGTDAHYATYTGAGTANR
jgi:sterol desaturase/sphingolipid hydroxylase (fatty acid hydroxylase superfamily)